VTRTQAMTMNATYGWFNSIYSTCCGLLWIQAIYNTFAYLANQESWLQLGPIYSRFKVLHIFGWSLSP